MLREEHALEAFRVGGQHVGVVLGLHASILTSLAEAVARSLA